MWDENCFITLTYDDEHLPENQQLKHYDFVCFMKRVRKHYEPRIIRYYMGGEYGEGYGRPHYHACLFNLDFKDKLYFARHGKHITYTSTTLDKLWGKGFALIGSLTYESARYVATYCTTRKTGKKADAHYKTLNTETGEIFQREPEYGQMSRRPGLGAHWLDKFHTDVYPHDEVIINGRARKPPRYYDKRFKFKHDLKGELAPIKQQRLEKAAERAHDNTTARLAVKEMIAIARLRSLQRKL